MNRRNVLKLSATGLASIALPGFAKSSGINAPPFPVEAIHENTTTAGQVFASSLRKAGIVSHAIEKDVSRVWYEHLRSSLVSPRIVLGLTFEPEAFYLGVFARELLHHQVIRLDICPATSGIMIEPVNLKSGKAFLDPLPSKASHAWPERIAQSFTAAFGHQPPVVDNGRKVNIAEIDKRMTAWAIAPIQPRQENKS